MAVRNRRAVRNGYDDNVNTRPIVDVQYHRNGIMWVYFARASNKGKESF